VPLEPNINFKTWYCFAPVNIRIVIPVKKSERTNTIIERVLRHQPSLPFLAKNKDKDHENIYNLLHRSVRKFELSLFSGVKQKRVNEKM